jgi:hypothetical protein
MLQDTDFFDRLVDFATFGDVHAMVGWDEAPGPEERYHVLVEWRFRDEYVGKAELYITPVLDEDGYDVFWMNIEFAPKWQDKKLYTQFLLGWMTHARQFKLLSMSGAPRDKKAEAIYRASGFEWDQYKGFRLDLSSERAHEWRAYAQGNIEQPAWRHAILAEYGLLSHAEGI